MADLKKIKLPGESSPRDIRDPSKVSIQQSVSDAGKVLGIDATGGVEPVETASVSTLSVGTLSVDTTPTASSSNLITSGGVYSSLTSYRTSAAQDVIDATKATKPVAETYTIASASWSALASSAPFTYSATVTATHTIGNDTVCELVNDNAVLFATHGFAIGSVSGQSVTIYSIGQPSASVTLGVDYIG